MSDYFSLDAFQAIFAIKSEYVFCLFLKLIFLGLFPPWYSEVEEGIGGRLESFMEPSEILGTQNVIIVI